MPPRKKTQKSVLASCLECVLPTGRTFANPFALGSDWRSVVAKSDQPGSLVVLSPPDHTAVSPREIAAVAMSLQKADYLIEYPDSSEARTELAKAGSPFKLPGGGDRLFSASFPLATDEGVSWVGPSQEPMEPGVEKVLRQAQASIGAVLKYAPDQPRAGGKFAASAGGGAAAGAVQGGRAVSGGVASRSQPSGGSAGAIAGGAAGATPDRSTSPAERKRFDQIRDYMENPDGSAKAWDSAKADKDLGLGGKSVYDALDAEFGKGSSDRLKLEDEDRSKARTPVYAPEGGDDSGDDDFENRDVGKRLSLSRICKVDDEGTVLFVVLEPRTAQNPDAQGDWYTADSIQKAMYRYMQDHRHHTIMHAKDENGRPAPLGHDVVKILENYLAPVDFDIDGEKISKGTWLQRVWSDPKGEYFQKFKTGAMTGASISGNAVRRPTPVTAA